MARGAEKAVYLTYDGNRILITGRTYTVREELKDIGAEWDSEIKCWIAHPSCWDEIFDSIGQFVPVKNLGGGVPTTSKNPMGYPVIKSSGDNAADSAAIDFSDEFECEPEVHYDAPEPSANPPKPSAIPSGRQRPAAVVANGGYVGNPDELRWSDVIESLNHVAKVFDKATSIHAEATIREMRRFFEEGADLFVLLREVLVPVAATLLEEHLDKVNEPPPPNSPPHSQPGSGELESVLKGGRQVIGMVETKRKQVKK